MTHTFAHRWYLEGEPSTDSQRIDEVREEFDMPRDPLKHRIGDKEIKGAFEVKITGVAE
jgi:hypothetical protein